jgi:hypothetical protein
VGAYCLFKEMSETYPPRRKQDTGAVKWDRGAVAKETDFDLEQFGTFQLGLHIAVLNREYLVVESATAIGWLSSEIYIIQNGKPALLKSVGSETPPVFMRIGKQDYVQVVNPARKIKRIPLLRRE